MEPEGGEASIRWRKQGDQGLLLLDQAISLVVNAASIPVPTEELRSRVLRSYNLCGVGLLNLNLGEGHQRLTEPGKR